MKREHRDLPSGSGRAALVYDGACPFCSRYASMIRLRQDFGLVLINARDDHPLIDEIKSRGFRLDDGMVLNIDDRFYHGAACLHLLCFMTSDSGLFGYLTKALFSRPNMAAVMYPWLAFGRRLTLRLLGREPLGF